MGDPASGVLGPVLAEAILAVAEELAPGSLEHLRVVVGKRDHNAVVDDADTDIAWADEVAVELSRRHPGRFYAFAVHPDFPWLTIAEAGDTTFSDEGAVDNIARDAGCPLFED